MLENKHSIDNQPRSEKSNQVLSARPPLQNLSQQSISLKPSAKNDPQQLKIYFDEIFKFLESSEHQYQSSPNYISQQSEINHTSRAFLIDWLISIHGKFKLVQETLYISVNLIDRYLEKRSVNKKQLQLVGITAIFIAAKYEEIYPPRARDFLLTADNAYTKQHLVKMEIDMLKVAEFQITFPTPWRFIEKYPECISNCKLLAEYILELGLVEYIMIRYKPSIQAAAVVYLSNLIFSKTYIWKIDEPVYSEIKDCVMDLYKVFKLSSSHPLTAVRDKYLRKKLEILSYESKLDKL